MSEFTSTSDSRLAALDRARHDLPHSAADELLDRARTYEKFIYEDPPDAPVLALVQPLAFTVSSLEAALLEMEQDRRRDPGLFISDGTRRSMTPAQWANYRADTLGEILRRQARV